MKRLLILLILCCFTVFQGCEKEEVVPLITENEFSNFQIIDFSFQTPLIQDLRQNRITRYDFKKSFSVELLNQLDIDPNKIEFEEWMETTENFTENEVRDYTESINSLSDQEKLFYLKVIDSYYSGNIKSVNELEDIFRFEISNGNQTLEEKDRMRFFLNMFESIDRNNSLNRESNNCMMDNSMSIAAGALISGLIGMGEGCVSGALFGFNLGSTAAGCMFGLITGTIEGVAIGTAAAAIACASEDQQ